MNTGARNKTVFSAYNSHFRNIPNSKTHFVFRPFTESRRIQFCTVMSVYINIHYLQQFVGEKKCVLKFQTENSEEIISHNVKKAFKQVQILW